MPGAKGMLVIADGKRNDIGTTAEAYSSAYLGKTLIRKFDEFRILTQMHLQ